MLGNFNALLDATDTMKTAILSDWGKLHATDTLINLPPGPDTLAWPVDLTDRAIAASLPGFKASVMQMLLPAKYQIYISSQYNGQLMTGVSPLVQRLEDAGNNFTNLYWIADSTDDSDYPSDQAIRDVFGSNNPSWDFFHSATGWTFAQTVKALASNQLTVTVSNQTFNPLKVVLTMRAGDPSGATIVPICCPYMSCSLCGSYNKDGLSMQVDIYDPNVSSDNPVASFVAHQADASWKAPDPWVDTPSQNSGYNLDAHPITNHGSATPYDSYGGAIQMTVYYNPLSN